MKPRARRHLAAAVGLALVVAANMATSVTPAGSTSAAGTSDPTEPSATVWLCRPGLADNPCESDLSTTVVEADGTHTVQQVKPARRAPIDCFYVYPTVSGQPTTNADLTIDPEETAVAEQQASRFSSVCRVFAPMYRQITIAGLAAFLRGDTQSTDAREIAYDDVRNAWREYLAHDNRGRGVVFIGHSQGTGMLVRLLQDEVDPERAVRRRMVSALLIGNPVAVPVGDDVGGSFEHLPACRAEDQTGCVVSYSSFDETPPPDSLFGRVRPTVSGTPADPDLEALCVNPADLTGGTGTLEPYFRTTPFPGTLGAVEPPPLTLETPWLEFPDLYRAHCEKADGFSWLQVTDDRAPDDTRPVVQPRLGPTWGLHLVDVNLALGNLVDLVRHQAQEHRAKSKQS